MEIPDHCVPMSAWLVRTLGAIIAFAVVVQACGKEPVRAELEQRQKQTGLNLVAVYDSGIHTVLFASRSMDNARPFLGRGGATHGVISPDGTEIAFDYGHLGVIRTDGSGLRQYLGYLYPRTICWSKDKSKVAFEASGCCCRGLWILDLKSGVAQEVVTAPPKLVEPFITTQCWSPDAKQFVYWLNSPEGEVRVYDTVTENSHKLANGTSPTWAPNGKWIAVLSDSLLGDEYFVIRPSGTDKKILFRTTSGHSGLWWSPDSRFVAYDSALGLSEGLRLFGLKFFAMFTPNRLRVRRLDDNAEDWVIEDPVLPPAEFQWVTNTALNPR